MQRVFEDCDPIYLRQLRQAAGLDLVALARTACLSVAHVRHLEGEGDGVFYSQSIKRQAYKRVLMILGADPPSANQDEVMQASLQGLHLDPTHNPVDRIVALVEHAKPMHPSANGGAKYRFTVAWFKTWILWGLPLLGLLLLLYMSAPFLETGWRSLTAPTQAQEVMQPDASASASGISDATAEPANQDAAPVAPPESLATLPSPNNSPVCAFDADSAVSLWAVEAHKPGNYVYLMSETAATVCVVDATQQATVLELKPAEGRSVYGPPPWQVSGAQLSKMQLYFQGRRLAIPETGAKHLLLVEKPWTR